MPGSSVPGERTDTAVEIVNGKALAAGRSGSSISSANATKPLLADGIPDNPRLAPCGSGVNATRQGAICYQHRHPISRTNATAAGWFFVAH